MEKFTAEKFFAIAQRLRSIAKNVEELPRKQTMAEASPPDLKKVRSFIITTSDDCAAIGLRVSAKCLTFLASSMDDKAAEVGTIIDLIKESERLIIWEMEDKVFMFVPPERAECFNKPDLLGKEVLTRFPLLQFDIVEAGNCYGSGRGTACVFHLMRVMETGVQEFGTKLGITLTNEKQWQNILDETNKAIKALPPRDKDTVNMSQAAANLYAVKLAWRNEVMHPKDTYTLEEADNLIRQVRLFMQQLVMIVVRP